MQGYSVDMKQFNPIDLIREAKKWIDTNYNQMTHNEILRNGSRPFYNICAGETEAKIKHLEKLIKVSDIEIKRPTK